jgi:hypothetical protein
MLIIGGNGEVETEVGDDSFEDEVRELFNESTPSQEAMRMTSGKKIENRFIIKNSQVD